MSNYALNMVNIDSIIKEALKEDIFTEDISTRPLIDNTDMGSFNLICKEDGVLCGLDVFKRVFQLLDETTSFQFNFKDGDKIRNGDIIGSISGKVDILLIGERVALNFLQRMSGIASYTNKMVKTLDDASIKIVDTRKTTPTMRYIEKYSVRVGGGQNHRLNLSDSVMLKDNHISLAGSITSAVNKVRAGISFVRKIEVETENMDMVKEALDCKAEIIMLDNMSLSEIKEAVKFINKKAIVEVSGNINLDNIHLYKNSGVDILSSGALTHSAPVLDFSLKGLKKIGQN